MVNSLRNIQMHYRQSTHLLSEADKARCAVETMRFIQQNNYKKRHARSED